MGGERVVLGFLEAAFVAAPEPLESGGERLADRALIDVARAFAVVEVDMVAARLQRLSHALVGEVEIAMRFGPRGARAGT